MTDTELREYIKAWEEEERQAIGPAAAREVLRLRGLVHNIDLTLRVPAAEYVPAIGDVFKLIDETGKAASDGK